MTRPHRFGAMAVALVLAGSPGVAQNLFRSSVDLISVNVSVKKGNERIQGLPAQDFALTDNGVAQQIQSVAIEDVPLDVSLVLDLSGSMYGAADRLRTEASLVATSLRPVDRMRVLTMGETVRQAANWMQGGVAMPPLTAPSVQGISLVYDTLFSALLHRAQSSRRHVVIAFTDGEDCGSLVHPDALRSLAKGVEATVYWLPAGQSYFNVRWQPNPNDRSGLFPVVPSNNFEGVQAACDSSRGTDPAVFKDLVDATGGEVYERKDQKSATRAIQEVIQYYRQSYVITYAATGVARAGWHALSVRVVTPEYVVRARSGYFVQ